MKKWYLLGTVFALVLAASSVQALNLGNVVKDTTKTVAKGAMVSDANKAAEGYLSGCMCDTATGQIVSKKGQSCQLDKVASRFNRDKSIIKNGLNRTAKVKSEVHKACYSYLQSHVVADWSYFSWVRSRYVTSPDFVKVWLE